jgi:hypothetical protein
VNAVVLLTSISSRRGNELKQQYDLWIAQVLAGSVDIQDTIAANAELAEDPTNFHSAVLPAVKGKKMSINYLVQCTNKPCCYLRVDPASYEVFAVEYNTLLPQCPELGNDLKFGHGQDLNGREETYEHNGLFCFFVVLSSIDDARLLEAALRQEYKTCRKEGTREYLSFPRLQRLMNQLKAKNILDNVKARILQMINTMTFIHSLHVEVYTADTVCERRSGIEVTFTSTEVKCRGRVEDREHQALLQREEALNKRVRVLEAAMEQNEAYKKRMREQEETILAMVEETAQLHAQLRKRRCVCGAQQEVA